jgi:membrane-bound serine protease (ClpP class)
MRPFLFIFLLFFYLGLQGAEPDSSLATNIKPHEGPNKVGKIGINDRSQEINESTWIYIKNALDYYKKNPPLFIILELNTPGGEVFAAEKISDALKEMDTQWNIPIVAVINNWAMSAGAMIAYSCRFIAVVKDSSMGAAEPVIQEAGGEMKAASEKVNSAIRADFANKASFFDRNPYLAEAMVDKDMIVVEREGKIIKLDGENQIIREGPHPDIVISPKGKLLTLNSEQLLQYKVANVYLPPKKMPQLTPEEKESGKWPASKELLFEDSFFATIPNASVEEYRMDLKTRFLSFLAMPAVASLLMLGMMLGFYLEFNHPGWGAPGALGVGCLVLLIISSFALEVGNFVELIFLAAGLLIIIIDLFFFPTFGILGSLGLFFFLGGLFALLLPGLNAFSFEFDTGTFNAAGETVIKRLGWFSGTLMVGIALIVLITRFITPRPNLFKKFVLAGHEQEGFRAASFQGRPMIGANGTALSNLRPAGKGEFEGEIFEAITKGRWVEKGAKIVVIGYDAGGLIVEEVSE